MTDEECTPLNVCKGYWRDEQGQLNPMVISCWKFTQEELNEINRTKRVWLKVVGATMPPVEIVGIKPDIKTNEN